MNEILQANANKINDKIDGWSFHMEHPSIATFYSDDGKIIVKATPFFDGEESLPVEIHAYLGSGEEEMISTYQLSFTKEDSDNLYLYKYIGVMVGELEKAVQLYADNHQKKTST